MNYKVGRNEKCPCGSGKKYKKCCLNNSPSVSSLVDVVKRSFNKINQVIYGDHSKRVLNRKDKVFFVHSYKKLPTEIIGSVNRYIDSIPLFSGGCHSNSVGLSTLDKRIDTIHGFVGVRLNSTEVLEYRKTLKNQRTTFCSNGLIKIENQRMGTRFFDFKRNMEYFSHSWNKFTDDNEKEIHFDLTKELNENLKNEWFNYFITESIDLYELKLNELENEILIDDIEGDKISLDVEGYKRLNYPILYGQ
jgi:hypothetical protein